LDGDQLRTNDATSRIDTSMGVAHFGLMSIAAAMYMAGHLMIDDFLH
jgi:hypothetical protein